MPHIHIEYSRQLEQAVDVAALVHAVHAAAVGCGVFPVWGVRTFAQPMEHACVGDGNADNGFVQIGVRIAPGRSEAVRRQVAQLLLDAALEQLGTAFETGRLGCMVELSEFDAAASAFRIRLADAGGALHDRHHPGAAP